ncbi:Wzz/FepE/Etk N-terminal domain-containing protein [Flavobacterium gyeonganense]|uniref:Wzz/FepE/Etk N-terminal domain-containing protein n=1 Tax=Flavobacterium gyeonganense TaxID=1310418 RepID=UPI00241423E9|nr:Wzz/FepE/Etk N-terminal domain-containing protein [Flavobacterium gyeonganense]
MENSLPVKKDEVSLKELLVTLKEWWCYLVSQWKIILIAAIIGAGLGLTYSVIKKPVYTATLSFALEDEKSTGLGGALGLASSFGLDIGGTGGSVFSDSNLAELFKSRSMVENTLLTSVLVDGKNISLAEMYIQNENWRENWKDEPKIKDIQFLPIINRKGFTRVHDSILGEIYRDLSKKIVCF